MNNLEKTDENNKIEQNKKKYIGNLHELNIQLFFLSIVFLCLGIYLLNYLFSLDEYTLGISMIFGIPIVLFLLGVASIGTGITASVFEIITIKKILTEDTSKTFKKIAELEVCAYICIIVVIIIIKLFLKTS